MRPAQKAPENVIHRAALREGSCCFNEAGAKSAGKPRIAGFARANNATGFNEAGAKSAGKLLYVCGLSTAARAASMRPAQKAPENAQGDAVGSHGVRAASMRPAQKAPENSERRSTWKCAVGRLQ